MRITASKLRQDVYRILDEILETGEAVEIERKGRRLLIVAADGPDRLESLPRRDYLAVDPEEIVEIDWSGEWQP